MKDLTKLNIRLGIRAILTGAFVWLCIFCTFGILEIIPRLQGALHLKGIIVAILVVPFAALGAFYFYKAGSTPHGFKVGSVMTITALVLDALITVPLIEIPKGNTYGDFFTYPLLWSLVVINLATVYVYWRFKLRKVRQTVT